MYNLASQCTLAPSPSPAFLPCRYYESPTNAGGTFTPLAYPPPSPAASGAAAPGLMAAIGSPAAGALLGLPGPAGRWSGLVGELVEGRADVALFPLTRTAARMAAIDVTYSYMVAGLSVLSRTQAPKPDATSILQPFTSECTVHGSVGHRRTSRWRSAQALVPLNAGRASLVRVSYAGYGYLTPPSFLYPTPPACDVGCLALQRSCGCCCWPCWWV